MTEAEVIFPIGSQDDFSIYLPPEGMDCDGELALVRAANAANVRDGATLPADFTRGIGASFVYAHPPDYRGRPMLHASVEQWREALRELRAMHIDTVIFQAALWRELNECFYRSPRYATMKQFGVLEVFLEAAELEAMTVYLGGYGSVSGWKKHLGADELRREAAEHRHCFRELTRLGRFHGMYYPCETAYHGRREPEKELRMRTLYREFSGAVKEYAPEMKVLTSPATFYRPECDEAEFLQFWANILDGSGIDVLMPQDCVGNCGCTLPNLTAAWRLWRRAADASGVELWSHTEIFERRSFLAATNLFPAAPERVARQLAATEPFVTRHCCWEALYFASSAAGEDGILLRDFLRRKK